jgi:DNA-binding NtrC family response regulator
MKNVLVIENERMIFLDIKIAFDKFGYQVALGTAHNIDSLSESGFVPDLIVMDIYTAKKIHGVLNLALGRLKGYKEVPIILTSTHFKPNMKFCLSHKLNVIGELMKPYNADELINIYHEYANSLAELLKFEPMQVELESMLMS